MLSAVGGQHKEVTLVGTMGPGVDYKELGESAGAERLQLARAWRCFMEDKPMKPALSPQINKTVNQFLSPRVHTYVCVCKTAFGM